MKKLKILLLALAATISVGAWAQEWTDVTSKITNPSFEADEGSSNITDANAKMDVTGWTKTQGNPDNSQWGAAKSNCVIQGIASAMPTSDNGNYYYIRCNWNADVNYGISQSIAELPAGMYKLTYKAATHSSSWNNSKHTVSLIESDGATSMKTMYSTGATWTDFETYIYKFSATSTLTIKVNMLAGGEASGQHYQLLVDDFKLYYCEDVDVNASESNPVDFTGYLSNPTIFNTSNVFVPRGWTAGARSVGNSNYTEGTNDTQLEAWSGGSMNFDYYQTITGLPNGLYTISAKCHDTGSQGGILYAKTRVATKTANMTTDYSTITTDKICVGNGSLQIGIKVDKTTGGSWITGDDFVLKFYGFDAKEALATLAKLIESAPTGKHSKATSEALNTAINAAQELVTAGTGTKAEIATAYSNLETAIVNANASIADYAKLKDAIDNYYYPVDPNYDGLESIITEAKEHYEKADLESCSESIASLSMSSDAVKTAMVNDYMYVTGTTETPGNYIYGVSLGEWTTTGYVSTFNNEHWSGTTQDYKNQDDSNGRGYNSSTGFEIGLNQDVKLPAGNYIFKACGRKSGDAVLELVVKNGDNVIGRVANFPSSNNTKGIDKSGVTNFTDGEFANSGNGYGWQWRYVAFTLEEETTVNVAVSASATSGQQWVSFGDYTIQTDDEANLAMIGYNIALNDAELTLANDDYKNVTGSEKVTLQELVEADMTGKEKAEIDKATTALKNATTDFKAAAPAYDAFVAILEKVENLDDAGKAKFSELKGTVISAYNDHTVKATDLNVYDSYIAAVKAQTTIDSDWSALGSTDRSAWAGSTGNYATNYVERYAGDNDAFPEGDVLTQTIKGLMPFAKYEVKFIAVANRARNIQEQYYGNGIAQIFANETVEGVEVHNQPSCTPGNYQRTLEGYADEEGNLTFGLKNVKKGGQWYVAQFTSLILKALPSSFDATLTQVGDAAYSSMYLDFPVEIPENVEAYYVTVSGKTATMNPIEGVIPANCGVILKADAAGSITFTQTSTEATTDVSSNVLIGFVVDTEVAASDKAHYAFSYKTGDTKPAFYIPESAESDTDPTSKFTAKAHKAYIELESAPNSKLDITWGGEATGINTIDNGQLTIDNSKAYNLNGMRVNPSTGSGQGYKGIVLKGGKKFLQK